jgi:molecular chaperone GrpE
MAAANIIGAMEEDISHNNTKDDGGGPAADDTAAEAADVDASVTGKISADVLTDKLATALRERDEYLAGWQRAKADFVNYRKEEMRHFEEVARYGNEDLIKDLLVVLDNFDLGLRAMEKSASAGAEFSAGGKDSSIDKGIYLIRSQIDDILKKRGLLKIEIHPGDLFDPAIAEAMAEIPSDKPQGAIVEEVESGYRLHDKVIRAARVIISKGSDK